MRKRPLVVYLLVLIMIIIILSFPVQVVSNYGHSLYEWKIIWAKISLLNYMVMAIMVCNAILTWNVSRWLIFTVPLGALIVAWNNYVVGMVGIDYDLRSTQLATVGFLFVHGLYLHPDLVSLVKRPTLRWWKSSNRVHCKVPVLVVPDEKTGFESYSFDLSDTGVFVTWITGAPFGLKEGDKVSLFFFVNRTQQLKVKAQIMRVSKEAQGQYPQGIGLRFNENDVVFRQAIRSYKENLHENVNTSMQ